MPSQPPPEPVSDKPLIIVAGPTGAGKSDLALAIASKLGGEIVNCDSVQLYRGFDIGAAKTPEADRLGIPHHLIDIIDAAQEFTAGDYARAARAVLRQIAARGRIPVVAGGTGFYIRALLEGLFPGPPRNPSLRLELAQRERRRPGFLHRALRRFDAQTAARIHPNDRNKLIRALEVCLSERRPISELFERGRDPLRGFRPIKLGLDPPRAELYRRLDERCRSMLAAGLAEEVQRLLASGVPPDAKPFQSIGYKQALALVQGRLTAEQALELMRRDTRRYAKRQLTWFRREPGMHWLSGFGTDAAIQSYAIDTLANYI
jgi:tRNA dimethylallyltransferase